jgi:hypothetical protein
MHVGVVLEHALQLVLHSAWLAALQGGKTAGHSMGRQTRAQHRTSQDSRQHRSVQHGMAITMRGTGTLWLGC